MNEKQRARFVRLLGVAILPMMLLGVWAFFLHLQEEVVQKEREASVASERANKVEAELAAIKSRPRLVVTDDGQKRNEVSVRAYNCALDVPLHVHHSKEEDGTVVFKVRRVDISYDPVDPPKPSVTTIDMHEVEGKTVLILSVPSGIEVKFRSPPLFKIVPLPPGVNRPKIDSGRLDDPILREQFPIPKEKKER